MSGGKSFHSDVVRLPTLQQRRQLSRLTIFYKAVNNEVAVDLPDYLLISVRETRSRLKYGIDYASTSTWILESRMFAKHPGLKT
jgi:hypothetical protein